MPAFATSTTTTTQTITNQISPKGHHKCFLLQEAVMSGSGTANGSCLQGRPEIPVVVRERIEQLQEETFEFFGETLRLYGVEELLLCFNGGKDCTVLLDLLMRYLREVGIGSRNIPMLHIKSGDSFPEIDDFVEHCKHHYQVKMIEYEGSLKAALTHMQADMPRIKAVFVGSRNTDPYCQHLASMQPTDSDWPPMMRLNPILKWSYHDIWHYIHLHNVPYCSLYNRGYTSVGNRSNTSPNPHLKRHISPNCDSASSSVSVSASECVCVCGCSAYKPAWELEDPTLERAGRLSQK